jgi:hypothetical protein
MNIHKTKLNQSQTLANETVTAITNDPLAHLTEQNAILGTFKDHKIISYHIKEKKLLLCVKKKEVSQ